MSQRSAFIAAATATADAAGAIGPAHSLILGGLFNLFPGVLSVLGLLAALYQDFETRQNRIIDAVIGLTSTWA